MQIMHSKKLMCSTFRAKKNTKVNDHIQSSHLVNDLDFNLKFRILIHIDFAQESAFWPGTY